MRTDGTKQRVFELTDRLQPGVNRSHVLAELERMFLQGTVPDPLPEGFLGGRLVTTSVWGPLDGFFRRVARLYMPWQGKTFDRTTSMGTNRFDPSARLPMRALWPSYAPVEDGAGHLLAFEFRNRVGAGALDPATQVLKIDYDFEANPSFIIRRVLDELVQIDEGAYLGKVLFRLGERFRPIGFFFLEAV